MPTTRPRTAVTLAFTALLAAAALTAAGCRSETGTKQDGGDAAADAPSDTRDATDGASDTPPPGTDARDGVAVPDASDASALPDAGDAAADLPDATDAGPTDAGPTDAGPTDTSAVVDARADTSTAAVDAGSDTLPAPDSGGPGCDADCWKIGVFGPSSGWPRTVQRTGTIRTTDFQCVVVGTAGGCLAQNMPPCRNVAETRTTTIDLTIAADGTVRVEAPYQDMCTADYVGGVIDQNGTPTGQPVPTTYPLPLAATTWYYAPRSIDRCRTDLTGNDARVEHRADTAIAGAEIVVTQDCATTMRDDSTGTPRLLHDTRHYVTRLSIAGP